MAVEWGLAGRGQFNYLDSLQQIGNLAAQQQAQRLNEQQANLAQQAAQQRQYAFEQTQRQDAARIGLADRVRAGDTRTARREALLSGDFDFATGLNALADDDLQAAQRGFDAIGSLRDQLRGVPVEQRAAIASPILAQIGVPAESLGQFDWTDASLEGVYALSKQGQAALKARQEQQAELAKPRVVGTDLVDGSGRLIYQGAKEADWIFDSDSGNWLQKPGTGRQGYSGAAPSGGGSGTPVSGRTQYGWTPRERNGGDNSDAAVDGKIAGMARALGISPDQDLSGLSDTQIAQALTLSEGGRGSIADRNNNPGNLRDPRTGAYRRFGTKEEGLAAAAAQVRRNRARGQNTIRTMVEGLPVGGGARSGGGQAQQQPGVINVRAPREGYRVLTEAEKRERGLDAGGQYQIGPRGQITSLGGGQGGSRKTEGDYRKEFEGLKQVKDFRSARTQFNALRETALNPNATAQDDIAVIFQFMKTLDPTSTVREGEFATAQNAGGIPDTIRNAFNRAQNGERLSPAQRRQMAQTAYRSYKAFRDAYNETAEQYRRYTRDAGGNPDRVARTYMPDRPQRQNAPAGRAITPTIRRLD